MSDKTKWCSETEWSEALQEKNCHFCTNSDPGRGDGILIRELSHSRLILGRNQHIRGYSILLLDSHYIELHQLPKDVAAGFLEDLRASIAALSKVFRPRKLNIEIQGNQAPHLHAHLKPRYADDQPAHARISHTTPVRELDRASSMERALAIRSALT